MTQDGQRCLGTEGGGSEGETGYGDGTGAEQSPTDARHAGPSPRRYSLLAVFAATDGGITRVFPNK